VEATACSCCGKAPEPGFVTLSSHSEIAICFWCLDGLVQQRRRLIAGRTGGWHVVGHDPIFTVSGMPRALEHYTKLGFTVSTQDDTYGFAEREDAVTIHLTQDDGDGFGTGAVHLHVDDAEAVARKWRMAGLDVEGPVNEDYGKAEGSHTDPDGNLIRFGSPLRSP